MSSGLGNLQINASVDDAESGVAEGSSVRFVVNFDVSESACSVCLITKLKLRGDFTL
jgi:hypothetical protein